MRKNIVGPAVLALVSFVGLTAGASAAPNTTPVLSSSTDVIEVAIVLDTSDSMKPLIDATRVTLWDMVNELALLEPPPQLRVALLSYGNPRNERDKGWVRIEAPLTSDLDLVSQRLFELETDGGAEFVGRALKVAAEDLAWTDVPDAVKLVFIAGNERADQDDQVDLHSIAVDTLGKDLIVHTVFCGKATHPDAVAWKTLADMARGEFAAIDHRAAAMMLATPFDAEMVELGTALNQTYIPIGTAGREGQAAQQTQDEHASELGAAVLAARTETKAGTLYSPEWDLLDALATGALGLHEIDEADLPDSMREMTFVEREEYLVLQFQRREEIRRQIREISARRRAHVADQIEKKGAPGAGTFDRVVRRAIREQVGAWAAETVAEEE